MLLVNKHKDILLDEFYLDEGVVRRSKDGYLGRFKAGDVFTPFVANGYHSLQIPRVRRTLKFSHLVLLLNGIDIPEGHIVDHIDGNKLNDSLDNLRVVKHRENNRNRKRRSDNTTGITGVSWHPRLRKWQVRKTVGDERVGVYAESLKDAEALASQLQAECGSYTNRHGL